MKVFENIKKTGFTVLDKTVPILEAASLLLVAINYGKIILDRSKDVKKSFAKGYGEQ